MINKKIAFLIGDGMADYPVESLGGKTPLEAANTPNMDYLAKKGVIGIVRTVPPGFVPGSDTANLSIFGYDPASNYTGRAPLEALNMGIDMGTSDIAFRCNLVTIDDDENMKDFSAGHIETEFAGIIIDEFNKSIRKKNIEFFAGVSYRHIMIWRDYPYGAPAETTPPHDIQGQYAKKYLPRGEGSEILNEIMGISRQIIRDSKAIGSVRSRYRGTPTSAWLWGAGKKPSMNSLWSRFGLNGYTISAVDLIHGIGRAAGLTPIRVEGATGYIDTNYTGKADALLQAIRKANFVFLHVESPDESGHEGNLEHKIQSIEDFDKKVVGRVMEGLSAYDDYSVLVMPDHPTPIKLRTHTAEPVPFCIYGSRQLCVEKYNAKEIDGFNERSANSSGIYIEEGHRLLEIIINGRL